MSKRSIPRSTDGYSLVELLIGVTIAMSVTAAALSLALSSRRLYDADQIRVRINDNLRSAHTFLVNDIRQAGERLGNDIFWFEIRDGAAGAPDELVLRRNLHDVVRQVCLDVTHGSAHWLTVSRDSGSAGCATPPTDGEIVAWRDFRELQGGAVTAYIYNPVSGHGEFFSYVGEERVGGVGELVEAAAGTEFANDYPVDQRSRIYLIEERRYRLVGDTLQLVIDGDEAEPMNLVEGLHDFQAQIVLRDDTMRDRLDPDAGDPWFDVWSQLRAVQIELRAEADYREGRPLERMWSARVLPRNIMSR